MRNLVLLNRGLIQSESRTYPDLLPINSVFDVTSDTITVALSSPESQMLEVQRQMKDGHVQVLASFPCPDAELLSFNHFSDSSLLVFVFANGDIMSATYDPQHPDCDSTAVEIVGSIDSGLHASSWSPDEETLAILTKENNLLLLSRLFEPIAEKQLNPDDIRVADAKHVSVGWGKEETQFKGKGFKALEREREAIKYAGLDLKEDSELRDPTVAIAEKGTVSSFDNDTVKISWRGDCEYFAVTTKEDAYVESTQEVFSRRVIRVFNREGELDSVSEAVDGLEHNLAWRPSGSLIASTQRCRDSDGDDVLQVAFYERNGLRHGEFNTRLNPYTEGVSNIEWSCNSDLMAFHINDRVQVWATKNYHWYLKYELIFNQENPQNEVSYIKFHPEKPLQLMVGTTLQGVQIFNFAYKISSGPTVAGKDVGMTVVIDGNEAKVTPLGVANVPPPVSYREYYADAPLVDVAVNGSNSIFATVGSNYDISLLSITLEDMKSAAEPSVARVEMGSTDLVKSVCFIGESVLAVLADTATSSRVVLFNVAEPQAPYAEIPLDCRAVLLKSRADYETAIVECIDGSVFEITESSAVSFLARFPVLCHEVEVGVVEDDFGKTAVAFGVSTNGKLFAGDKQLTTGVTSFKTTHEHLCLTNAHSQLCFVHLKNAADPSSFSFIQNNATADERVRQIERGSTLVSCIPSKYSVVLQAPRGNLETICPRIMVLNGVRSFIAQLKFHEAFVACRTHRVDLDLLHDYDPELFERNVELFIKQVKRVDYLDLFVSCLHQEDVTKTKYNDTLLQPDAGFAQLKIDDPEKGATRKMIVNKVSTEVHSKVNKICDSILSVLSQPQYEAEYLQTRVTAYACQVPANLHGALELISSLSESDEQEKALTHLCFLSDVNKLYNHALELYDVRLALNIAQKSQKDPKEYLPFLQQLHVQEPLRKKFMIDDHLRNFSKSLGWLFEEGATDELDDYVVKHALYKEALRLYKYDEARTSTILKLYADFLFEDRKYTEAAVAYEHLGMTVEALESYISDKRWKEALSIAGAFDDRKAILDSAERLCAMLIEEHKYSDAAEIQLRVLDNVDEAVRLHCKSYHYDDAILLAVERKKAHLIESVVDEQLGEGFGVIAELLADCTSQANSQLRRLRELRQKKEEDPFAFYGIPNDDLDTPDNVSIAASETSTTPSFFTKYTGKTSGTAKTGASRKTSKNRKREERKRAKGRKGTIYEEEYLIKSVGRLIERLDQTEADAISLTRSLVRRHKMHQAYQIQQNWGSLVDFLKENIVEIHNMSEKDRERINDEGEVYLIDEIPVPAIREFPKVSILDF